MEVRATPSPQLAPELREHLEAVGRNLGSWADFAEMGNLMTYGPAIEEAQVRLAWFVDRILKGAKAAEIAVELPTRFELVINLKTAKALGIEVPPMVLNRADRVIE
jgi:putative ABC transport system substrate-binding protein